jgi:pSer/pThr/pTyr-binding forkhead associated (FHA) protein
MKRVVGLVGRSQRCLISVGHTSLSRLHCSLVRTPLGLWVVDLLSRTGTYLNGDAVRCARLREGDRLQVGKYVLRFWYQQPRPKIVVPISSRSEAPPAAAPAPLPAPSVLETKLALSVPGKGRRTMLQFNPAPQTQTAVTETNPGQTLLPDNANSSSAENSLVVALVGQFDLMQQQMFGQFQESLLMATRLFASLHQEQMAAIRQELAGLQGIAGELRALQEELTKNVSAANAPRGEKPVRNGARPLLPTKTDTPAPPAESNSGKPGKEETAPMSSPLPTPAQGEEVHDWLTQRIAALETEQQSRWSKLLDMVLGR